jgi:nitrous oxide reductase accessory protein NosL
MMGRIVLLFLLGCGAGTPDAVKLAPVDPGVAECAVCGMTVMEQPSPRAQVVHRKGEHRFLCSVSDLRAYLQAPSPLGKPLATYVEVLGAGFDPTSKSVASERWFPAEKAIYVFGAERPEVMGLPALTFSELHAAESVAGRMGTAPLGWEALARTPFNEIPKGEP